MALFAGSIASAIASAGVGCCASLSCAGMRCIGAGATQASARLAYTLLFLGSQILAWIMRDFAKPLMEKLPWVVRAYTGPPPESFFGEQAVLRVSLGNALFFGGLACALLGASSSADGRVKHLHRGSWMLKTLAWALLTVLPFFMPNGLIAAYAWVARFASGIFLVVQMIILLDFAYVWSEAWSEKETNGWLAALLGATAACYAGALTLLGLAFRWFAPHSAGDCSFNVFVITFAIILGVAYSAASLHPSVSHGSLLCSGTIFIYNAYLTVCALASEPPGYACNSRSGGLSSAAGQAGAAAGMVLTLASVAYSAARAGSSGTFLFSDPEGSDDGDDFAAPLLDGADAEGSDDESGAAAAAAPRLPRPPPLPRPLRYNLSAFHAVYALAACYTAMLLTDWASGADAGRDMIGIGWTSTWVKILSSWVTSGLYGWSLAAPLVFPDRF